MIRYERQLSAEQGLDPMDDVPVLKGHNDGALGVLSLFQSLCLLVLL